MGGSAPARKPHRAPREWCKPKLLQEFARAGSFVFPPYCCPPDRHSPRARARLVAGRFAVAPKAALSESCKHEFVTTDRGTWPRRDLLLVSGAGSPIMKSGGQGHSLPSLQRVEAVFDDFDAMAEAALEWDQQYEQ